jgi:hypothetical protein
VLALLLASHMFAFDSGCVLDTYEGSPCEHDGCGVYCDIGLVCDFATDTCVSIAKQPSPNSPQDVCLNASLDQCPQGLLAIDCTGEAKPTEVMGVMTCDQQRSADGHTLYCCTSTWSGLPSPVPTSFRH